MQKRSTCYLIVSALSGLIYIVYEAKKPTHSTHLALWTPRARDCYDVVVAHACGLDVEADGIDRGFSIGFYLLHAVVCADV